MSTVLHLLESPFIVSSGKRIDLLPQKPVFLLIYLALRFEWVSRDELLGVFYPENTEQEARHSLRVLINRAKAVNWSESLEIEPHRLRWLVPNDVQMVRETIAKNDWAEVIKLHQKPLLSGFPLLSAPGFEAWIELEREALVSSWRKAVLEQVAIFNQAANHLAAEALLKQLLQQDWLAEDIVHLYMEQSYLSGQRNLAINAYESFKKRLQSELGLDPLEKTQQLLSTIQHSAELNPSNTNARPSKERTIPLRVQHPPRLIAREQEQMILQQATTPFNVVVGEPGIGKTRLLKDTFPQAFSLKCLEGLNNLPYYPVLEFLRTNVSKINPGLYREDLARLLPELSSQQVLGALEPDIAKVRLLEAIALTLESFQQTLLFDDIQWIDSATLELLMFLVSRNKTKIYATCRKGEESHALRSALHILQRQHVLTEIQLKPLVQRDIKHLMADLIGTDDGPEKFSQWLYTRSSGNVFFILETLRNLFENGTLQDYKGTWHSHLDDITRDYSELDIPPKISEVITRRLELLSPEAQRVIQAASVVRQGLTPKLLAQLSGLSEWATLEALEQAETSELIRAETFSHDLFRQSIYTSLSVARKRHLHAQTATLLIGADPLVLADHWLLAEQPSKALGYYLEAIETYRNHGWLEEAKTLIEKTQPLVTTSETRWKLEQYLTEIYVMLGQYEQAEPRIATLLQTAPTSNLKAKLLGHQTQVLLHHGNISETAEIARSWEQLAKDNPELDTFDLRYLQAEIAVYQEEFELAKKIMEPLLEPLRQKAPSINLIRILTGLAVVLDWLGDYGKSMPLHHKALESAKTLGARHLQADVVNNMLWNAITLKQTESILPLAEETLALGEYNISNTLRNNLAYAYMSLEQYKQAQKHYQDITRYSSDPTLLCFAYSHMCTLYYKEGQIQEGEEALNQALGYVFKTDFPISHIRVGIATLLYGSDEQLALVKPLLVGKRTSDSDVQSEYEKALQKRGLSYPVA